MAKDDWIRITLRMPPKLHRRLIKSTEINNNSLNQEMLDCIENALDDRWVNRLLLVPIEDWMQELENIKADSAARFENFRQDVKKALLKDKLAASAMKKRAGVK